MNMKIETRILKDLVAKAIKGSGRNTAIGKTTLVSVVKEDKGLTLITTDAVSNLKVSKPEIFEDEEKVYFSVDSDLFTKLVMKTTSQFINIELNEEHIEFKGNGTYKLPLLLDENGDNIIIPDIDFNKDIEPYEIEVKILKGILNYNKPNISKNLIDGVMYSGYYVDKEAIITYNTESSTVNRTKLINSEEKILLPSSFVDLFTIIDNQKVKIQTDGNKARLSNGNFEIVTTLMEAVDRYPAEPLKNLNEETFVSMCEINKDDLLSTLDRLSLFLNTSVDKNAIRIAFNKDQLVLANKFYEGSEIIEYINKDIKEEFTELVDLLDLKHQLTSAVEDTITFRFGDERGLMIKTKDIYQIIPYLTEEQE